MKLGEKIRIERKKDKMTLVDLAKVVGISKMTLQRIETGKTSPSIAILGDIAQALQMPITNFIEEDANSIKIFRKDQQLSIVGDNIKARNIFPRSPLSSLKAESMAVNYVEAKPGAEVEKHSNNGFEWVLQLTGKSELIYDGKEYIANEGDVFFYNGRRPHSVKYYGRNKFLLISFK